MTSLLKPVDNFFLMSTTVYIFLKSNFSPNDDDDVNKCEYSGDNIQNIAAIICFI